MNEGRRRHWITEFNALGLVGIVNIPNPIASQDIEEIHEAAAIMGVCVYGSPEHGYSVHWKT